MALETLHLVEWDGVKFVVTKEVENYKNLTAVNDLKRRATRESSRSPFRTFFEMFKNQTGAVLHTFIETDIGLIFIHKS